LDALLGSGAEESADSVRQLPTQSLASGKYQPRRKFDAETMAELVSSIKEKGVLQPLIVRESGAGQYEIIAGERRWLAAKQLGLALVPAIVHALTDVQALEVSLIDNMQREDLTPMEEAAGFQRLIDEFGYTQEKISNIIGKSRSFVANALRLLQLPDDVKEFVQEQNLSAGHARALLSTQDPMGLAHEIKSQGLSVRDTEQLVSLENSWRKTGARKMPHAKTEAAPLKTADDADKIDRTMLDLFEQTKRVGKMFALKTKVQSRKPFKGSVVISFSDMSQVLLLTEVFRKIEAVVPYQKPPA